jgi:hypothetical protein
LGTEDDKLSKAIEKATDLLLKFSIPLYKNHNGRPELHGTGFFVKASSDHFLVSAAHVLDKAKELFYYCTPNTLRHLSGRLVRSKGVENRAYDLIDVGVLKLSDGHTPPYPEVDKFAMDISYLQPRYRPRTGKTYALIGFPATKSGVDIRNRNVLTASYAYRNKSIGETEYQRHGLDPQTHVALPLDLKKGFGSDGKHRNFPKPQGMSGSPIIVLFEEEDAGDARVFPVVAVATTYLKPEQILFGTDVAYVLDAIDNAV